MALDPCTWASSFLKFSHAVLQLSGRRLSWDRPAAKATRLAIRAVRSLAWRITFRFRPSALKAPDAGFFSRLPGRLLASLRSTQDE